MAVEVHRWEVVVDQEVVVVAVVGAHQHLLAALAEVGVVLCLVALGAVVEVRRCLAWAAAVGLISRALVEEAVSRRWEVAVEGQVLEQREQAGQGGMLLAVVEEALVERCSSEAEEGGVKCPESSAAMVEALKECFAKEAEVERARDLVEVAVRPRAHDCL